MTRRAVDSVGRSKERIEYYNGEFAPMDELKIPALHQFGRKSTWLLFAAF